MSKMTKVLSQQAFDLRQAGFSWMKVGRQMNLSASFVRHLAIYNESLQQRPEVWTDGLQATHSVALRNAGFSSKSEVLAALQQEPTRLLNHVGIDNARWRKLSPRHSYKPENKISGVLFQGGQKSKVSWVHWLGQMTSDSR